MGRCNYKAFNPEEVKKGLHLDLLRYLFSYSEKSDEYFYDIHIYSDGYCTIIEWLDHPFNSDKGVYLGEFKFVNEEEYVMQEVYFPDGHYEYIFPEDVEECLNSWLKEHPEYKKNQFGMWYNPEKTIDINDKE